MSDNETLHLACVGSSARPERAQAPVLLHRLSHIILSGIKVALSHTCISVPFPPRNPDRDKLAGLYLVDIQSIPLLGKNAQKKGNQHNFNTREVGNLGVLTLVSNLLFCSAAGSSTPLATSGVG